MFIIFKLNTKGIKILKCIHIIFVSIWIGAGVSMMVVQLISNSTSGDELFAYYEAIKLIDDYVIIPGAMGCLFTGLIYSLFTNWGFIKYYWVLVKWLVTIVLVLTGTFLLGPSLYNLVELAGNEGLNALNNPLFQHYKNINTYAGLLQLVILVILIFISIYKPWGKRIKINKSNTKKIKNNY